MRFIFVILYRPFKHLAFLAEYAFVRAMAFKNHLHLHGLLLLVMLAAQAALAHHATVHFTLHEALAHNITAHASLDNNSHKNTAHPTQKQDHQDHKDHCGVCVLAHSLIHADLAHAPLWTIKATPTIFISSPAQSASDQLISTAYHARAPPTFLI